MADVPQRCVCRRFRFQHRQDMSSRCCNRALRLPYPGGFQGGAREKTSYGMLLIVSNPDTLQNAALVVVTGKDSKQIRIGLVREVPIGCNQDFRISLSGLVERLRSSRPLTAAPPHLA
jgi:hypothetical protein